MLDKGSGDLVVGRQRRPNALPVPKAAFHVTAPSTVIGGRGGAVRMKDWRKRLEEVNMSQSKFLE
jgi:hypothetical protein